MKRLACDPRARHHGSVGRITLGGDGFEFFAVPQANCTFGAVTGRRQKPPHLRERFARRIDDLRARAGVAPDTLASIGRLRAENPGPLAKRPIRGSRGDDVRHFGNAEPLALAATATSFSGVLEESGAPRRSIYHHFHDGKTQLAQEAIRRTSKRVLAYLQAGTKRTLAEVLARFIGMWRRVVLASNGASGYSVAGVAIDSATGEGPLMELVRTILRSWVDPLAQQLEATGVPPSRAGAIAPATPAGMTVSALLLRFLRRMQLTY